MPWFLQRENGIAYLVGIDLGNGVEAFASGQRAQENQCFTYWAYHPLSSWNSGHDHYSTQAQPSMQVGVVITDPPYKLQGTRPMGTLDGDISSK